MPCCAGGADADGQPMPRDRMTSIMAKFFFTAAACVLGGDLI